MERREKTTLRGKLGKLAQNWRFAPPEWVSIAGETELYIFDQLYSAWIEKQN